MYLETSIEDVIIMDLDWFGCLLLNLHSLTGDLDLQNGNKVMALHHGVPLVNQSVIDRIAHESQISKEQVNIVFVCTVTDCIS